jgi:hypothetical protein
MGLDDMEVALRVAIQVNVPKQVRRLRLDRDLIGYTALPPQVARAQMELTVAASDIGVVGVGRVVLDAVRGYAVPPSASLRNSGR